MSTDAFSLKEIVIEIKNELRSFREKYDADQEARDIEIAKRPTRKELYTSMGIVLAIVGTVAGIVGG